MIKKGLSIAIIFSILVLFLVLILVLPSQTTTQNISKTQNIDKDEAENIDFSSIAIASTTPTTQHLDYIFEDFIKQWNIVGMSVAIAKEGKLVYAKGFGYADKERKIKVQPHHLFRIASASKLVTAVGIMKLVEEGKLKLNDKVFGKNGILKEFNSFIKDTLAYQIEIEHLLTHTAGWRNQLRTDPMFVPVLIAEAMKVPSPISFENVIKFMLSQRGYFVPGTLYDYSNFGYCLLGKVIEKITHKSYEKYMQEEILAKIGIKRMQITKNKYKDRLANEVKYYDALNTPKSISIYNPKDSASRVYEGNNTEALGAAGGWSATAIDMLKLACAIDNFDTRPDFLQKKTINRMVFPITEKDSLGVRVLGWKQVDKNRWWRTGNLASTCISLTRREDGFTWVLITNTGSWRGPFFPYEMEGLMERNIPKIQFPAHDLFKNIEHLEMFRFF
jgi:CubicO group peptidase (beta-lactamase class C family)